MPTNVVSSICDDRGEEPTYNGVDMSTLIQGDNGVADVISLLWFKRALPKYATRFIEMCIMLCADHGPCVSGKPPQLPSSPCLLIFVRMCMSLKGAPCLTASRAASLLSARQQSMPDVQGLSCLCSR